MSDASTGTVPSSTSPRALNAFQRLMREWTVLAPYNAGQIIHMRGTMDSERLAATVDIVVRPLLHRVAAAPKTEDANGGLGPSTSANIEIVAANGNLNEVVSKELNRPFPRDTEAIALRGFLLPDGNGNHFFGIIYDHWLADSVSIRAMMLRIFTAYADPAALESLPPLEIVPCRSNNSGKEDDRGENSRWRQWSAGVRAYARHRRAIRTPLRDPMDFTCGFFQRTLTVGLIDRLRGAARDWSVTVHDLFLAAMAQSISAFVAARRGPTRHRRFRAPRDRIGLGTIADLRRGRPDMENVFGLFLGCFTITVAKPESRPIGELARSIGGRTRNAKGRTIAELTAAIEHAQLWWNFYREPRHKAVLFQKHLPLAGGISNVNLSDQWMDQRRDPRILDYIRVSPTGPLLPLVFTLTTIGSALSLGVTFRTTAFTDDQARAIADDFVERLEHCVS